MCDILWDLREALGRYAVGFDPALLSEAQAGEAVEAAAAIEATAATLKTPHPRWRQVIPVAPAAGKRS